jgi:hypothetical protein
MNVNEKKRYLLKLLLNRGEIKENKGGGKFKYI